MEHIPSFNALIQKSIIDNKNREVAYTFRKQRNTER